MTDFEKNIADKLNKVQYQAPVDAWGNIAKALDEKRKDLSNPWKTRFFIAASLLLLTATSIPFILLNQKFNDSSKNTPISMQPENNIPTESSNLNPIQPNIKNPEKIVQATPKVIIKEVKVPVYIERNVGDINSSNQLNEHYLSRTNTHQELEQNNVKANSTESIEKNYAKTTSTERLPKDESQLTLNETINKPRENTISDITDLVNSSGKQNNNLDPLPTEPQPKVGVNALISNQFWGTSGGESFISSNLDEFSIDNASTFSYGGRVSIPLSPKIFIRSGLSWIQAQQNTFEVPLYFGDGDYLGINNANDVITYSSQMPLRIGNRPSINPALNEIGDNQKLLGDIEQQITWFEVPLEMEYRFLQKNQLFLGVTGGMSNYFLNKNDVLIRTSFLDQTTLGEANNLNDYSYSINGGVNFGLNLNQKFGVQVEPQFKYLLQTFTDDRLQPYVFGLNFSLGYNF